MGNEVRVADFILKRNGGFPPLLIEIENPAHRLFIKSGDLSSHANHARSQLAEWNSFISQDSRNVQGKFAFLAGPKEGLVIIGKGLDEKDRMLNTRFSGTLFWTYDFLILYARMRWNSVLETQCKLLGIQNVPRI